jgi:hypothetical protein
VAGLITNITEAGVYTSNGEIARARNKALFTQGFYNFDCIKSKNRIISYKQNPPNVFMIRFNPTDDVLALQTPVIHQISISIDQWVDSHLFHSFDVWQNGVGCADNG